MTNEQMTAHVEALCIFLDIDLRIMEGCTIGAYPTIRRVHMIPITSEHWYAIALHEIGHVALCHRPENPRNWKEVVAWKWAKKAAVRWTPEMEACEIHCLSCWGISEVDRFNPAQYLVPQSIL